MHEGITRYHWMLYFDHDRSDNARKAVDKMLKKVREAMEELHETTDIKSWDIDFDIKEDVTKEYE